MGLPSNLSHRLLLGALALGTWQCTAMRKTDTAAESQRSAPALEAQARRVTDSSADQLAPSFSADGTRLIYQSNSDGNWELYTLSLGDGRAQRLTDTPELEEDPSWSPDGRLVLCTVHAPTLDTDAPRDVLVMDADGRNRRIISGHGADDFCPRFSPDGRHIYFISDRVDSRKDVDDSARQTALFRFSLENEQVEQLTEGGMWSTPIPGAQGVALRSGDHEIKWLLGDASWSEAVMDSSFIFGQADYSASQGWVVSRLSRESDGRLRVKGDGASAWQEWPLDDRDAEWTPAFSQDGTALAFAGRVQGQWDLFLRRLPVAPVQQP